MTITTSRVAVPVAGETLGLVYTQPQAAATRLVVMVHGGPGGSKEGPAGLYVDLADLLAAQGIASVRFDFLGVGESSGRYEDMTIDRQVDELRAVVHDAQARFAPSSLAFVGESYGATSVSIVHREVGASALVLLWPALWLLDGTFASYVVPDKLERAERDGFIVEEGARVGLDFLRQVLDVGDVSGSLDGTRVPTLLVHGDHDGEVPFRQSLCAAELLAGHRRVVIVPEGDHCLERPSEREIVHRETVDWLTRHL
ncbi:MAG TPA: alpha/beta fold hydrolase [Jiangellaceae bacterium]